MSTNVPLCRMCQEPFDRSKGPYSYCADCNRKIQTFYRNGGEPPTYAPRPCGICGSTWTPRLGVRYKFCSAACVRESARARYASRTCPQCDGSFRGRGIQVYCSSDCMTAARSAPCLHCGDLFVPERPGFRFCSRACGNRYRAGWSRSTDLVHVPKQRPTHQPEYGRAGDSWTVVVQGPCQRCGDQFTALCTPGMLSKFCSLRCQKANGKDRRRARKRDAYVADVNRRYIFERDRWTCQLCGKRVAKTKSVPHPNAPVIDHILPLAAGGTHEPRNAQCAHFLCNSLKSDRGTDQLRLIG